MDANKVGDHGGNITYSRAALRQAQVNAHGNEVEIQNNVQFSIDGVFGTLAPVDNQAFGTGLPAITGCNELFYALWVNNTNVLTWTAGAKVDPAKLGGTGGLAQAAVPYPDLVSGNALVGLVKVKVGTAVTFTPGTTSLNATNITTTFQDTAAMPTRAIQS